MSERRAEDYVYLNLDMPDITKQPALDLLRLCKKYKIGAKLGTTLTSHNSWLQMLAVAGNFDVKLFADTKANDISQTVDGTLATIFRFHPHMVNIHGSSSESALAKFLEVRDREQSFARSHGSGSLAIAVTMLTDKTDEEIRHEFNGRTRLQQSRFYAQRAASMGFDGITCSEHELRAFNRESRTRNLLKVLLGVRPEWAPADDQAYTITPADAVRWGAYAMGIGRPIYKPPPEIGSPENAIESILEEVDMVLRAA